MIFFVCFIKRVPNQNEIYQDEFLSKGPALENLKEDYANSKSLLKILEEQHFHLEATKNLTLIIF